MSVKNVCVNTDGSYEDICGYADIPDPAHPGELKVGPKGNIKVNFCIDLRHSISVLFIIVLNSDCAAF